MGCQLQFLNYGGKKSCHIFTVEGWPLTSKKAVNKCILFSFCNNTLTIELSDLKRSTNLPLCVHARVCVHESSAQGHEVIDDNSQWQKKAKPLFIGRKIYTIFSCNFVLRKGALCRNRSA